MTTAYVTHPRFTEHHLPEHPEHAGRIRAVWRRLGETGLAARMHGLDVQPVTAEQILAMHTRDYLDVLQRISSLGRTVRLDADTYANPTSYAVACLSAGAVCTAVDAVLRGDADNALAVVRPPGHHAMPDHGMGFCLLGNIAIAAADARRRHQLERILIFDYDVHHGNGTEAMFYDDPSVLFVSTHQYPLYPGTGALEDIGVGAGVGTTANMPIPGGHGDDSYAALFEQVVWPLVDRFRPQLILVSAGFDAHWADPLAGMRLSLNGFAHLSSELMRMADQHCGGKIVFVMEGGYNLDALSDGVCNLARVLLGDAPEDPLGPAASARLQREIQPLIAALRQLHGLGGV
jgi:acetoin utilization deacetylase AcuC-like enzyme